MKKYGDKAKNGVVEITLKKASDTFVMVEEMPSFPGGVDALRTFVSSTMKYPFVALENGIYGQVIVGFVVSKTGKIINAKVSRRVDPSLDKEALRIVNSMPKWNPGKQNGEAVDVAYEIPIKFNLPKDYQPVSKEQLRTKTAKIGNINWVNNTVYSSAKLNGILGIRKGSEYSKENVEGRIQSDVSSLYLDNGYVFSKIDITEVPKSDGTVDLTFTVYEGKQGKIGNIEIKGNKNVSTKDILNEIKIKPGDLFSKAKIIQSIKALNMMGKFNPEEINPSIIPEFNNQNGEFGTVNLIFNVAEK
jgi:TonB family protein